MKMLTFAALDFETANTAQNSACEIGVVRVEGGQVAAEESFFIRPPSQRFQFTYLHGIDWSMVADAPPFDALMPKLNALFAGAAFLAAHYAPFDRSVMAATCAHYGLALPVQPFLCTVKLARAVWNIHPTKLDNVCEALGIDLKRHHRAGCDALACAEIVRRAMEKLGEKKFRDRFMPKA
jgi:DNA polymerase III subunit epsilon